ncbi:MAG TPA: hypothetical protein PL009_11045 [Flavipsychrobacter sp.]|nr:hypothetical protein [Flavipsychrobacter sp.]
MKQIIALLFCLCMFACTKSNNTSYSNSNNPQQPPATKGRWIKFAYDGKIYGVAPVYEGLADTPKHSIEATGITASQFVKTKAGDTILITIALSDEGTKPLPTVVEDTIELKQVPPSVSEIPTPDASSQFRVVVN